MKADSCGTWTEQARAKMGWKSPAQVKALVSETKVLCSGCQYFHRKMIERGDGSFNFSPYCRHVLAAGGAEGNATRETASCNCWERKMERKIS